MSTVRVKSADARLHLMRLVHVARRELQLDEDTYRAMLVAKGGAVSAANMDVTALQAVLDHMKRSGFKVRSSSKPGGKPDRRQDSSASGRKVRALWLFLHRLGAVQDPSERALAAYVKRIAKVDDMHWASSARMHDVIETLKKWAMRVLPPAIEALKAKATEQHRRQPFDQVTAEALQAAVARLQGGAGYDAHWAAWACLTEALGQPVSPELQAAQSEVQP